ncbi:DUF6364 family protein [Roseibacillus ishigakijimensis]|uniref:Uncharacterized protein n=1 Tax=Roseibacillus ishigakijimensis TaxID=454146 RepID=A0A934VN34_9BACT|nr:DUF6364 family protein [Roseibacillus ishigakijimensis]MBK1834605.1 hypothetical protein [Roseibacillus ishigakijimensis]
MNRLTISLDDELYAAARSHAYSRHLSLSKAINELLRAAISGDSQLKNNNLEENLTYFDPDLGFAVSRSPQPLKGEEIERALAEEDAPATLPTT